MLLIDVSPLKNGLTVSLVASVIFLFDFKLYIFSKKNGKNLYKKTYLEFEIHFSSNSLVSSNLI